MQVNIYQIEHHINQKDLKEYAVFCYFKYMYKTGCIYKYNSVKLATKSKYSASFIRKHVSVFLKKGWCRMHGENLIFNKSSNFNGSESKIKRYEKINIKGLSIKQIIELFHLHRITLQNNRFERKKKLKLDLKSNRKYIRHKAESYAESIGIKTPSQLLKLPNEIDKLTLSNQVLRSMFNCSQGKASAIINSLSKNGFIKIYRIIKKRMFDFNIGLYADEILKGMGASYTYGKYAFLVQPLEITIC